MTWMMKGPDGKMMTFSGDPPVSKSRFRPPIDPGERIVSMIQFKDDILVATEHYIYRLNKETDEFEALRFKELPPEDAP